MKTKELVRYFTVLALLFMSVLNSEASVCPVTIGSNFNGTSIAGGNYIWFNGVIKVSGRDTSRTTTITASGSTITFTADNRNYTLSVPDSKIVFSPTASSATTTFEGGQWITTIPANYTGNVFLSGLAYQVPGGGLPGGINPVTWASNFMADDPGLTIQWKWAAAVYSNLTTNYNSLDVKADDGGNHAGTPQNYKSYVIGGARGGGGSNYTGSYSGTKSTGTQSCLIPSDTTPPAVSITSPANNSAVNTAIATITGTIDDNSATVKVNGTTATVANNTFTASGVQLSEGPNNITATAEDQAGNTSTATSNLILDTIPPTGSISINNGAAYTKNTSAGLTLTCNDTGSGCGQMQISSDNTNWTAPEAFATNKTWTISTGDGPKNVYVKYADNAGNWSVAFSAGITLDTTPPTLTISAPVNNTSVKTPMITVQGTASDAGSGIASVDINNINAPLNNDTYTADIQLAEGPNQITVTATDQAGNKTTQPLSTTLDTIAPVITITSPIDGSTVSTNTVNVTGTIDDNTATVTVNGIAATINSNSYSAVIQLAEGPNQITVAATDQAGNKTTQPLNITLDIIAPVITITSPIDGSTVNTNTVNVTGTIDDNTATVTVNGINAVVLNNAFTAEGVPLTEGGNTITAVAKDMAENTATDSKTITYAIPNQGLTITIDSPINGSSSGSAFITVYGRTNDGTAIIYSSCSPLPWPSNLTPRGDEAAFSGLCNLVNGENTITVTATTADGRSATASVMVYGTAQNTTPPQITITSPTAGSRFSTNVVTVTGTIDDNSATVTVNGVPAVVSNNTFTASGIPLNSPCNNGITVTATNTSGYSSTQSVSVIYNPPVTLDISYPKNGGTLYLSSQHQISATIKAESSFGYSILGYSYIPFLYMTLNETSGYIPLIIMPSLMSPPYFEWTANSTVTLPFLKQGINTIKFWLRDCSGYQAVTKTITVNGAYQTSSLFTITSPADGTSVTTGTVDVQGTVNDNSTAIKVNGVTATVSNNTFIASGITLNEGSNTIQVAGTDVNGNYFSTSISVTYLHDVTPPAISITSPKDGDTLNTGAITVSGIVNDEFGVAAVTVNGIGATVANNAFSASNIPLTVGSNTITVTATDTTGNPSVASVTINYVIDRTPPGITITSPLNGSSVNTSTITVSGTIDDNTATVTANGINAAVANNKYTASGVPLTEGLNTIEVIAKDQAGNETKSTLTIYSDTTAPSITTISPQFNTIDVPLDTSITVTFSETMDASSFINSAFSLTSDKGETTCSVTVSGSTATFSPTTTLRGSTVYTFLLKGGTNSIRDSAGNGLAADFGWSFKTKSMPVELNITEPNDGETINRATVLVKGTVNTQSQEVGINVNGVLAEISGTEWVAQVLLTAGTNTIEATATDTSGNTDTQAITIYTNTIDQPVKIGTNPQSGIAPLNTAFTIDTNISNTITSYRIDFEGDGVTDLETTDVSNVTHTYDTPGIYYPTITVTDNQYNMFTDTTMVNVLDKTQMDALLKSKWEGMKGGMSSVDVTSTLNYFTSSSREKYSEVLTTLKAYLPSIAANMRDINLVSVTGDVAEYRISRTEDINGQSMEITYFIYFTKDMDGLWKIESF